NKFDPNAALTRAAYAQMLVNAIGHSTDSADTYFDDVPTDAWFYHNVAVASQLGIVSGFGDGTFRPNDLITREQMALMTQKAAVVMGKSLVGADVGTFTDDADIADWSRDAVYTLANAGIINGMGDGTFAPQANATRAQAAVIIYNAFVK
ncbi:MAG: S-layer homology domain-containing protein, partial [Clostridia bacterium]|nr:S-layer homology domain-containing protein [Clostridia bacterium]